MWHHSAMSEIPYCNNCAELMSDKDHRAESSEGDALCISCRKSRDAASGGGAAVILAVVHWMALYGVNQAAISR